MIRLCLVLVLCSSVYSESVRETETWIPMATTQSASVSTHDDGPEASGDASNGSDFGFTEDDEDYEDEMSGSGDTETETTTRGAGASVKPGISDNRIPDLGPPVGPTVNEVDIVQKENEIGVRGEQPKEDNPSNVLMSQATGESIFNKTEVLAALIAGGAVGLLFAVLLILLLIYRMKKKDEGSYDLGKKPIYKKAPTTEIYA